MRVKAIQLLPFQHITILKFHVFCVSFLMVSFFGVVMLFLSLEIFRLEAVLQCARLIGARMK